MRLIHCDGTGCDACTDEDTHDDEDQSGWLRIEAWNDDDCGDYCSWQCLTNAAMARTLDG